jgi:hypothetical protein
MVKMEICSDSEDQQVSKLNESFLMAYRIQKVWRSARLGLGKFKCNKSNPSGGGAKALPATSKEISSTTNGSFDLLAQSSCEAPSTPNTLLPES